MWVPARKVVFGGSACWLGTLSPALSLKGEGVFVFILLPLSCRQHRSAVATVTNEVGAVRREREVPRSPADSIPSE